MLDEREIVEVLDEYVEDMLAGRLPRVYHRMADAIGVDVESLLELIPLFEMAALIYLAGRGIIPQPASLSVRPNGKSSNRAYN